MSEQHFLRRVDTVYNVLDEGINIKWSHRDYSCPSPDPPAGERNAHMLLGCVRSSGGYAPTEKFPYSTSHSPVNKSPHSTVENIPSRGVLAPARVSTAQSSHPISGKVWNERCAEAEDAPLLNLFLLQFLHCNRRSRCVC